MWREMPQINPSFLSGHKMPYNRVCERDMEKEIRQHDVSNLIVPTEPAPRN
jgi:hypothetical protein